MLGDVGDFKNTIFFNLVGGGAEEREITKPLKFVDPALKK